MINSALQGYGINRETSNSETFGTGLINSTWKLIVPDNKYILQRVNNAIFETFRYS
jgi:hypothetical protein